MGNYIFERFPSDAAWMHLELTHEELGQLRYMNHEDWVALSGGTRLVSDGAANVGLVAVKEYVTEKVQRIEAGVRGGWPRAPLILVATDREVPHVILDGHGRSAACHRAVSDDAEFEVIAGYSPAMVHWPWY